jgi:hypothetical protein
MKEIVLNIHMHTRHSDGTGTHRDIAQAAIQTGLDAVIVTDHNKLVMEGEGYYSDSGQKVLVLIGEEIHDPEREPEKNHLLVMGVDKELAQEAKDLNRLLDLINQSRGLSFLAHPIDPAAPQFNQSDFSWVDWNVSGYTGIELWNGFSEFKTRLNSTAEAVFYAYQPKRVARGPFSETLRLWDRLTSEGRRVVAVGGSDAHALHSSLGLLKRTLFPYQYHFQAVNTHLLLPNDLSGNLEGDKKNIYDALRRGHAFIGYDLPHPTRGFRFSASNTFQAAVMGDEINFGGGITLQVALPRRGEFHLIKDGCRIQSWRNCQEASCSATSPGVYRIEAYLPYKGLKRGWIFSNPIYIRE